MIVRELAPDVLVGFRPMVEDDRRFIMSSWLRGFHQAGDWPRRLGTDRCPQGVPCGCCRFTHRRFFDEHGPVLEKLLARSTVTIACNPADEKQVLGYVVAEQGVLHWLFVKAPFRWDPEAEAHPRIGTALMEQAGLLVFRGRDYYRTKCSHWTKQAGRLPWSWGLVYDPFLLPDLMNAVFFKEPAGGRNARG